MGLISRVSSRTYRNIPDMDLHLKLYYFGIAGKGEAIRLALAYVGHEFEDYKFENREEFIKMKESGELLFGQVPALKVTNSKSGKRAGTFDSKCRHSPFHR